MLSPTASAVPVTSSSGALTNTPQISARRRSDAAIRSAAGSGQRRGDPGHRIMPSAQAPASTARSASSRRVSPQILMRGGDWTITLPSYASPRASTSRDPPSAGALRLRRRALGERGLDGALAPVAHELDLRLVALALAGDRPGQVLARPDPLAVDRDDDVAAEADLLAVELGDDRAAADPGLGGGAAGRHGLDERALVGGQVEVGQRLIDGDRVHAEEPALHAALALELREDPLGRVDRHGESDPDVATASAARLDLRVDADHAAGGVEQRATRVARVDRGVGLDDPVDLEAVGSPDRALGGRHHPGGQRALE